MKAGSCSSCPYFPHPCPLEPRTELHLQKIPLSHLSDLLVALPCQGRYFLVRDVTEKMDVLGTVGSCGAPNFRQVQGGLTVFGMGQPSLSGFRRVLQKLQKDGHRVSMPLPRQKPGPQSQGEGHLGGAALEALEGAAAWGCCMLERWGSGLD